MTERAAVYCRLSQDRTGAGVVVERQERECRELATSLGWDVLRVGPVLSEAQAKELLRIGIEFEYSHA